MPERIVLILPLVVQSDCIVFLRIRYSLMVLFVNPKQSEATPPLEGWNRPSYFGIRLFVY
jgi:hypothetical protein